MIKPNGQSLADIVCCARLRRAGGDWRQTLATELCRCRRPGPYQPALRMLVPVGTHKMADVGEGADGE
jgi:hypothetical protein